MTLLRLMLGGSGAYTLPAPPAVSPYPLSAAPIGAINPWQTPGAYSHGGFTLVPFVSRAGSVGVIRFNETTKLVTGTHVIASGFEGDAHSSPSLLRRASDGKILAFVSKHNAEPFNVWVSSAADDPSAWSASTNLDSQLLGVRYTDSQPHESSGNLYLFYRDEPTAGTDSRWCISHTSPATPTSGWPAGTIVYRMTGSRSYVISVLDSANAKIHFIASNAASTGYTKLGHFYLNTATGTYHKSDGTGITLPITSFTSITTAYSGTSTVLPYNVSIDGSGNPVFVAEDKIAGAFRYIYVRFNGTTWSSTNFAAVGVGYEYSGAGTGFGAWGACIRDSDVNTVYAIRDTGGISEVWKYETADSGATFTPTQLTSGSTTNYTQMICVRGDSAALQAFCQQGRFASYVDYNVGLVGFGV